MAYALRQRAVTRGTEPRFIFALIGPFELGRANIMTTQVFINTSHLENFLDLSQFFYSVLVPALKDVLTAGLRVTF